MTKRMIPVSAVLQQMRKANWAWLVQGNYIDIKLDCTSSLTTISASFQIFKFKVKAVALLNTHMHSTWYCTPSRFCWIQKGLNFGNLSGYNLPTKRWRPQDRLTKFERLTSKDSCAISMLTLFELSSLHLFKKAFQWSRFYVLSMLVVKYLWNSIPQTNLHVFRKTATIDRKRAQRLGGPL